MAAAAVVGREAELGRIAAFLAGIADGPDAFVLSGAPGIGKTVLWERGVAEALADGRRVLTHRAVEAEAGLAFTGLTDLLTPLLEGALPALPSARRHALAVALMLEEPGEAPPDTAAVGFAVADALRASAAREPVLLAIDDLQWLDTSTATVLPVALRRVHGLPVSMFATLREAPGVSAPFDLPRTFDAERLQELRLAPLDLGALHRLVGSRLGLELARPELERILRTSGGNPFFALELARERGGRIPASLREALGGRLARLPERSRDVLLAAAALTRPTVDLTIGACDGPRDADLEALDGALRAGIATVDGDRVLFTHPLLASLAYEDAPPWRRRGVHARLALAVEDVEQRARHLALAADGADPEVAAELDGAARAAAARGATASAAQLADLAADRTPEQDEAERRRRRTEAAHFHHLAGDFGRATQLLATLADEAPPGGERADLLHTRALIGREDLPTRVRLCEQALEQAGQDDARRAQILGFLAINRWLMGDVPAGLRDAREGLRHAERLGDPRVLAMALGRVGLMETWSADVTPGLLERGVALEATLEEPLLFVESPAFINTVRLYETGGLDRARDELERFVSSATGRGDEHTRQWAVLQLMSVERYAGRLERALEHAAESRAIAEQTQELQYRGMVEHFAALVEADSGRVDEARESAELGLRIARSVSDQIHGLGSQAAMGHLELVLGRFEAAASTLRDLPERLAATGDLNAAKGCWADAVEAFAAIGDLDAGRRCIARVAPLLPRLGGWTRVGVLRGGGLLAAAEGDRERALHELEQALAADGEPPLYPMERARTLLALGAVQRQALQRRAARETLEQALRMFEEMGARPWARKAQDELARISGRRASSDGLTESEDRVARLAAEGRQNKEIAAALYLGVGTVERHLTNVYRKLGVRSRTELAGRFAKEE